MARAKLIAIGSAIFLGIASAGNATPIVFTATLSGANENPANASLGTGFATVILDQAANTLQVDVTFSGLSGFTTASHIHCCEATPGANLNVMVATTTPTFAGFPLGVTSGTYHSVLDLTLASSYNPLFITSAFDPAQTIAGAEAALINGLENEETYLNIHTSRIVDNVQFGFPGGEIRGLLVSVPEPASIVFLVSGLRALGFARGRRAERKPGA